MPGITWTTQSEPIKAVCQECTWQPTTPIRALNRSTRVRTEAKGHTLATGHDTLVVKNHVTTYERAAVA